jgi:hypothetical protein
MPPRKEIVNSRMLRRARQAGEEYGRVLLAWYDYGGDAPDVSLAAMAQRYPQLTLRAAFLTGVARAIEQGAWEELA